MTDRVIVPPVPCSRCGNQAHLVYIGLNYGYVECLGCDVRTVEKQIDDAIQMWNEMNTREASQ